MSKRVNRAIELLEQGQPIYYTGAPDVSYEGGREMAAPQRAGTARLRSSRTIPTDGTSEEVVRNNAWMCKQVLARGVHGVLLCHAETPGAVKAFVESCRHPFSTPGVGEGLDEGRRGAGGQASAAAIWGLPVEEYLNKADVWPLNPQGELLLGIKIENRRALANAEQSAKVPGIGFGEWGPGDMGMSLGHLDAHDPPYPAEMAYARHRVKEVCREAGIHFLNGVTADNVVEMIDEGVIIGSPGKAGEAAAALGRAHTGRTMPV